MKYKKFLDFILKTFLTGNEKINIITKYSEIEELINNKNPRKYEYLYHNKTAIHNILYDKEKIIKIPSNNKEIKFANLFYLTLLIRDQPCLTNYIYNFEFINNVNNYRKNNNNIFDSFMLSMMIIELIENYKNAQDFYDDNYRSAIKCRTKDGEPLGNIGIAGGYTNKYFLSDDRTEMKIYLSVDVRGLNAQGGEITYKNVNYTAQKIYDIKESFDEVTNQTWIDNMDLLENESENYHIIRTGDSYVLCKTVQKTFDLPFEITFSLDYSVENNIWLNPSRINATNILTPVATDFSAVISNFSLDIKSSCSPSTAVKATPDENFHLVNFRDIDSKNSVITLDDGTSYYLVISSAGGGINENTNRFEEHIKFQYKTVPDPALADEIIVIDTRKIKQITINGDVIYTKGEFENVDKTDIP